MDRAGLAGGVGGRSVRSSSRSRSSGLHRSPRHGGRGRSSVAGRRTFPSQRCRRMRRPTHRSNHVVTAQGRHELPAPELRSSGGADRTTGHVTTPSNSVVQRCHGHLRLHRGVNGVPDDPVGRGVLERTDVQPPFTRPVFGDVADPEPIRSPCGELAPGPPLVVDHGTQVAVNRRTGPFHTARLLPERRPPAVARADLPRRPGRHRYAGVAGLIDQKPVAEFGVVTVGVEQRVGAVGLIEFRSGDRGSRANGSRAGGRC